VGYANFTIFTIICLYVYDLCMLISASGNLKLMTVHEMIVQVRVQLHKPLIYKQTVVFANSDTRDVTVVSNANRKLHIILWIVLSLMCLSNLDGHFAYFEPSKFNISENLAYIS